MMKPTASRRHAGSTKRIKRAVGHVDLNEQTRGLRGGHPVFATLVSTAEALA